MKKWIAMVLIGCLCLSLMPTAFATEDKGLEQAILTARAKIAVPEAYTEFSSYVSQQQAGDVLYNLSWTTPEDALEYKYVEIGINQRGDIFSYYTNTKSTTEMHYSAFTQEEVVQIAADWLESVNPDWMKDLPLDKVESNATASYHTGSEYVRFYRYVNGLPYCGNQVSVRVDNCTGQVCNMSASWTYEDPVYLPEEALSDEELYQAFLKESPLSLHYQPKGENEAMLIYSFENPAADLNARTGEPFAYYEVYDVYNSMAGATMEESAADSESGSGGLRKEELENVEQISSLLSQEELRSIAESLPYTTLKNATFADITYSPRKDGEKTSYIAFLEYGARSDEDTIQYHVTLDAETGALLSYYKYGDNDWRKSAEQDTNTEEAVKTAEGFVSTLFAPQFEKTKSEHNIAYNGGVTVSFVRHENDIPFAHNYYNVNVSADGKEVTGFFYNWDEDILFEDPADILTLEEAQQTLFEIYGMKLSYALTGVAENKTVDLKANLDYTYGGMFSAKQGILVDYNGEPWTEDTETQTLYPTDMEGHFAKEAVDKLIATGALEGTEAFRPDEAITLQEMLTFACGLSDGYIPYGYDFAALSKSANRADITLFSEDPDAAVTREQAVQMLIEALGYGEVAALKDIYQTSFSDEAAISDGKKGYVALAKGLKLISGDSEGTFRPLDFATRAEAAMMMHNYLGR